MGETPEGDFKMAKTIKEQADKIQAPAVLPEDLKEKLQAQYNRLCDHTPKGSNSLINVIGMNLIQNLPNPVFAYKLIVLAENALNKKFARYA